MPERFGNRNGRRPAAEQLDLLKAPPLAAVKEPDWSQLPDQTRQAATKLLARLLLDHGRMACGPEGGSHDVR
jgi:acyl-CoA synthetase (AMP-forming)/AMP-acid ligase II